MRYFSSSAKPGHGILDHLVLCDSSTPCKGGSGRELQYTEDFIHYNRQIRELVVCSYQNQIKLVKEKAYPNNIWSQETKHFETVDAF